MNEYTRFSKCHTTNETVYTVGLWSCSVLKWGQYASAYMCDGRERTFSYMTERPMLFDDYLNRLTAYIFDVIAPKEMVEVHTCKATQSALPRCIANRCSNHLISKDTCVITTHPICDCFLFHSIKPHFFSCISVSRIWEFTYLAVGAKRIDSFEVDTIVRCKYESVYIVMPHSIIHTTGWYISLHIDIFVVFFFFHTWRIFCCAIILSTP